VLWTVGAAWTLCFWILRKHNDKVPRRRLLVKLRAHGVKGRVLRWIKPWVADRKQHIVLSGKSSDWKSVLSGLPQRSLLGPILFLVFINNLDVQAALVTIVQKFADDTKSRARQ
jgi:ribonuclease P/MRP protein subunit RPP40